MPDHASCKTAFNRENPEKNNTSCAKQPPPFDTLSCRNSPFSGDSGKNILSGGIDRFDWYIIGIFVAWLFGSSACLYYAAQGNFIEALAANVFLIVFLAALVVLCVYWGRDAILKITEEMSLDAVFAGIGVVDTAFFLVADSEGKIIHTDAQYKKHFGLCDNHSYLSDFLGKGTLEKSEKEALEIGLLTGKETQVGFSIKNTCNDVLDVILTVQSIDVADALRYSGSLQKAYKLRRCFRGHQKCVVIKATERTCAEEVKRKGFDDLSVGIYAATAEGLLVYWNKAFQALAGNDLHSGMNISEWLHEPVDVTAKESGVLMQLAQKDGTIVQALSKAISASGTEYTYHIIMPLCPIKEKAALAVTRPHNGSRVDFLEMSPIAQLVLTENGEVSETNSAFCKLVGHESEEGKKWNLLDIVSGKSKADVEELIRQAVKDDPGMTAELKPVDVQFIGANEITALLYIKPLPAAEGEEKQLIGHLIDITEQKNLELRFAHSQKMQAVGQLAGGIAHDFNNLLTAMIGFCDLLLLRHPAGDQSFADLMQIKQNTNRAANLVRQLLAFSRKQTLQPEILDITVVLAELSSLVRRLIGENIDLKVHHGQDLWLVKVDQGQLDQVMINLAVNARDAMNGGGTLTIRSSNIVVDNKHSLTCGLTPSAEDEVITPGNYVLIEVIDTGSGIPKNVVGKIFEPFFSTKEVGSGTGLGLSTVYGIVKQTGGYIYVTSKEGEGTTFSIFLKGYDRSCIKEVTAQADASEKVVSSDLTGNGTILLVEDETPVRIFSSHALTNKGYTVLEANSGEAALRIIAEQGSEINVIITDVIMPGMNGPAMIEEISAQYPHIKVIFISGYAEDIFIKTYGAERKFNFLPKPFTLKQLAGKVKEVMNS